MKGLIILSIEFKQSIPPIRRWFFLILKNPWNDSLPSMLKLDGIKLLN